MPRPALLWMTLIAYVALTHAVAHAQAIDSAASAAAVAPFVDEQTFGVVHVDLSKVRLGEAREFVTTTLPKLSAEDAAQLKSGEALLTRWVDGLRAAGAQRVYAVASLADIPARPPFVVITLAKGADVDRLKKRVLAGPNGSADEAQADPAPVDTAVIQGQLCLGHANTLARLKTMKPAPRPELEQALKLTGDAAIQAVLLQSDDTRRVLKETLAELPGELREYSGKDLATIAFMSLSIDLAPKPDLRIGLQTGDKTEAARVQALISAALAMGKNQPVIKEFLPRYDELAKSLTPRQDANRLMLSLDNDERGIAALLSAVMPPLQAARSAAQRMQSTNNAKQLGIAMHLYHETHKHFPPAASAKDGKSLLSWRVAILPHIEQQELYDQFHHDEPWDSEHNLKLVAKMPKVFAPPGVELKAGHTNYLVPTGKGLIFNGGEKTPFSKITDGLSNTILVVEANADRAVPWTKPEDLAVDLDKPLAGLDKSRDNGFIAAFGDGSVHFISNKVDAAVMRNLLEIADGKITIGY